MRPLCRITLLMTVLLCAASIVQAAPDTETDAEIALGVSGVEYVARSTSDEESPVRELEGIHIPEPQTLLLAVLAICGLSAIHLRRRWG